MRRRDFLKAAAAAGSIAPAFSQAMLRPNWATQRFFATGTDALFSNGYTKTGATLRWLWSDGTHTDQNLALNASGGVTPGFLVQSEDGWAGVTKVELDGGANNLTGQMPSFAEFINLDYFVVTTNPFSGLLPSFARCTKLTYCGCGDNGLTSVVPGSFATQKDLASLSLDSCALSSAAVNQILADCVVSLGLSGRVTCSVALSHGTNGAPTGQGITDKATLIGAGWTVTTN